VPELILRELRPADEQAFAEAVREFARTDPDWTFAFQYDPDADFAGYLDLLRRQQKGEDLPAGWVPHTYLVAVVDGEIVGRVSIRHRLNDFLREVGGHVGYGVVPPAAFAGAVRATASFTPSLLLAEGAQQKGVRGLQSRPPGKLQQQEIRNAIIRALQQTVAQSHGPSPPFDRSSSRYSGSK